MPFSFEHSGIQVIGNVIENPDNKSIKKES